MSLTFISLFAGIEGFGAGFESAGMKCVGQVEIDPQCRSVLARHYPGVERFTDVQDFSAASTAIRPGLICGGFPCQDLSVAGKRAGLAGGRSGLWFEFRRILAEFAPGLVCIENVPGLLSSNRGRDMGTVLGGLGQLGYRWAYRILDAQYFGVAQRRERVFIVGSLGGWPHPAEILFDAASLPGNSPPSRSEKSRLAGTLDAGSGVRRGAGINPGAITEVAASLTAGTASGKGISRPGRRREDDVNLALCLNAKGGCGRIDGESETFVVGTLDSYSGGDRKIGNQFPRQGHLIACPLTGNPYGDHESRESLLVPFDTTQITSTSNYSRPQPGAPCHLLAAGAHAPAIAGQIGVRRLTPRECEWLQGFETDWTRWGADGKEISDSARYRMLGNAVNVAVSRWLGRRIVEATKERA